MDKKEQDNLENLLVLNVEYSLIRHTTASDGLNRGMGIEEVQAILGHESIATTMIYAKVSKNNVKLHHTKCIV